ncbi:MAG: polysaccharide deacetylase family protein [Firmicutes bacterium]|nr:polysaccharide deacetylase family protein [Bacillota bacterium]
MKFIFLTKRGLCVAGLLVLVLVGIVFAVDVSGSSGVYLGKPFSKNLPINSLSTEQKVVVLTLELDSEDTAANTLLVETVTKYGVPFVAFVSGQSLTQNEDLVQQMLKNDQATVGLNGNFLTDNTALPKKEIDREIAAGKMLLEKVTNKTVEYYRAPFGKYDDNVIGAVKRAGMFPMGSTLDTSKYDTSNNGEFAKVALSKVTNGGIISVSSRDNNASSLVPLGIVGLQSLGYEFVSLDSVIIKGAYSITSGGQQVSA